MAVVASLCCVAAASTFIPIPVVGTLAIPVAVVSGYALHLRRHSRRRRRLKPLPTPVRVPTFGRHRASRDAHLSLCVVGGVRGAGAHPPAAAVPNTAAVPAPATPAVVQGIGTPCIINSQP
jgi:hypothetical protein